MGYLGKEWTEIGRLFGLLSDTLSITVMLWDRYIFQWNRAYNFGDWKNACHWRPRSCQHALMREGRVEETSRHYSLHVCVYRLSRIFVPRRGCPMALTYFYSVLKRRSLESSGEDRKEREKKRGESAGESHLPSDRASTQGCRTHSERNGCQFPTSREALQS